MKFVEKAQNRNVEVKYIQKRYKINTNSGLQARYDEYAPYEMRVEGTEYGRLNTPLGKMSRIRLEPVLLIN